MPPPNWQVCAQMMAHLTPLTEIHTRRGSRKTAALALSRSVWQLPVRLDEVVDGRRDGSQENLGWVYQDSCQALQRLITSALMRTPHSRQRNANDRYRDANPAMAVPALPALDARSRPTGPHTIQVGIGSRAHVSARGSLGLAETVGLISRNDLVGGSDHSAGVRARAPCCAALGDDEDEGSRIRP